MVEPMPSAMKETSIFFLLLNSWLKIPLSRSPLPRVIKLRKSIPGQMDKMMKTASSNDLRYKSSVRVRLHPDLQKGVPLHPHQGKKRNPFSKLLMSPIRNQTLICRAFEKITPPPLFYPFLFWLLVFDMLRFEAY